MNFQEAALHNEHVLDVCLPDRADRAAQLPDQLLLRLELAAAVVADMVRLSRRQSRSYQDYGQWPVLHVHVDATRSS